MFQISIILIIGIALVSAMVVLDKNKKMNTRIHSAIAKKIFNNSRDVERRAQGMYSTLKALIMGFGLLVIIGSIIGLTG